MSSRPFTLAIVGALGLLILSSCGTPAVLLALREERVKLGQGSSEVVGQTGPPDLWIAKERVETLFYKNGERAVFVSLLDDKVVAYDDRAEWPAPAERAAKEADKPVSKGRIRVGMSEAEVLSVMGKPSGVTAEKGLETFHWVSDDESDSTIEILGGQVVGYVDMETTKFTQNVPRHSDRKNATTSGRIRVGMDKSTVQGLIGKQDGVSAKDGIVTHRYDASAVFGNDLVYYVAYRDDRVVGFSQENLTLAKKERKEREAREKEQQEASQAGPSTAGRVASLLFGFLLNTAVQSALAKRGAAPTPPPTGARPGPAPVPIKTDTCGCPEIQCGNSVKIQPCSARCVNTRAACSCTGQCPAERRPSRGHTCSCL